MKHTTWSHAAVIVAAGLTYNLTIIEDEETPLAPQPIEATAAHYFACTLVVMCVLAIVCAVVLYVNACNKYRKRYLEITERADMTEAFPRPSWNIQKLKLQVLDAENRLAEKMLGDV